MERQAGWAVLVEAGKAQEMAMEKMAAVEMATERVADESLDLEVVQLLVRLKARARR